MRLDLLRYTIRDIRVAEASRIDGGVLSLNTEALRAVILKDDRFRDVEIEIARPGESKRITHVLDVVQPRFKPEGPGTIFPGWLGPSTTVGSGRTVVLDGVAVIEVGRLPEVQEGLVDMSGPGAQYSPFASTVNLVLVFEPKEGLDAVEYDHAIRLAGLETAAYLARLAQGIEPDSIETYALEPAPVESLPRVAYIYQLQSRGTSKETFVYGKKPGDILPTLIHPNEPMDGAIVSGDFVIPCQRNATYFHLNNPVIHSLYQRHGREVRFAGVIITNQHNDLAEKERSAMNAAKLARLIGAEGVIITKEGGGHADIDLMLNCRMCEREGIKTALLANELAGADGRSVSLVDTVPEADAIVSTGNNDHFVELPAVKSVLGCGPMQGLAQDPGGPLITPLAKILGSTNQLGYNKLTARTF